MAHMPLRPFGVLANWVVAGSRSRLRPGFRAQGPCYALLSKSAAPPTKSKKKFRIWKVGSLEFVTPLVQLLHLGTPMFSGYHIGGVAASLQS